MIESCFYHEMNHDFVMIKRKGLVIQITRTQKSINVIFVGGGQYPKSFQNDPIMIPKWFLIDPEMISKWPQTDPKMITKP